MISTSFENESLACTYNGRTGKIKSVEGTQLSKNRVMQMWKEYCEEMFSNGINVDK